MVKRDHGTFKELKCSQKWMGRGASLPGDLGGLPEDSDVDPRRNKNPLKFQARDQCDWLRGVTLEPEVSSFWWEALSTDCLTSKSLGEHTG